jgi:hypothetical protein
LQQNQVVWEAEVSPFGQTVRVGLSNYGLGGSGKIGAADTLTAPIPVSPGVANALPTGQLGMFAVYPGGGEMDPSSGRSISPGGAIFDLVGQTSYSITPFGVRRSTTSSGLFGMAEMMLFASDPPPPESPYEQAVDKVWNGSSSWKWATVPVITANASLALSAPQATQNLYRAFVVSLGMRISQNPTLGVVGLPLLRLAVTAARHVWGAALVVTAGYGGFQLGLAAQKAFFLTGRMLQWGWDSLTSELRRELETGPTPPANARPAIPADQIGPLTNPALSFPGGPGPLGDSGPGGGLPGGPGGGPQNPGSTPDSGPPDTSANPNPTFPNDTSYHEFPNNGSNQDNSGSDQNNNGSNQNNNGSNQND